MADRVVLLTIPQLRRRDVTPGGLGTLDQLSSFGSMTPVVPPFPGLAASAFATLMTGLEPREHGLIGNVFLDPVSRNVVTVPLPDSAVQARKLWHKAREVRPGARVLLWFTPDSQGADVDLMAWTDRPRILRTAPESLASTLVDAIGPFPSNDPEATDEPDFKPLSEWILKSASMMIHEELPDLSIVRVPLLGQVARRFGPDGRHAGKVIPALEKMLSEFFESLPERTTVAVVTESIVTPVVETIFPNRILRELGLLTTVPLPSGGIGVDLANSPAFALADHQLCHLYFNDPSVAGTVASAFAGDHSDGVALVVASDEQRNLLGLDHPRAGNVVLVACPDAWFSPSWWTSEDECPNSPPESAIPIGDGCPLNTSHVNGSLGAPPPNDNYLGVLLCSEPDTLPSSGDQPLLSAEVVRLVLDLLRT